MPKFELETWIKAKESAFWKSIPTEFTEDSLLTFFFFLSNYFLETVERSGFLSHADGASLSSNILPSTNKVKACIIHYSKRRGSKQNIGSTGVV